MSFWDKVRRLFGGGATPLEAAVRDAMLARVGRREAFTALDVANEVTASDPHRTADDLRAASDLVLKLFNEGLLTPLGYGQDPGGAFSPRSSAPLQPPPPNVVAAVGASLTVEQRLRGSIHARAARREAFSSMDLVYEVTRTGAADFMQVVALAGQLTQELLPALGYGLEGGVWRPGVIPPVHPQVRAQQGSSAAPPARNEPRVINDYQANPEILGLSAEALRLRALKVNPYRTAWIGRVDTIPPQSDERTALIDRGLLLRGLLTQAQLAEIHRVGDLWLKFHDAERLAQATAAKTADEAIEQLRAEKAKLRAEKKAAAAQRAQARAEAVARRRAEDIIFLGRGVSRGLADRRSNLEALAKLGLPAWSTPADVGRGLGLTIKQLRWLCFHAEATRRLHYVPFELPKRSGGTRLLAAPHATLKAAQRKLLAEVLGRLETGPAAHGFVRGRSIVTNATPHVRQGVVVNVDLKDFFPSVTFPRVRGLFASFGFSPAVATVLALLCTEAPRRKVALDGAQWWVAVGPRCLPQGAPTSPAIANLVTRRLDRRLAGRLGKQGWVYTRYADDLSFSHKALSRGELGFLHARVRHVVEDEGFALNPKKGRVQGRGGRQDVTGVVVNEHPAVRRDEVRRLRALLHQAKKTGLEAQNRERVPEFRRVIEGKIAFVLMVDRARGEKLKAAFDALP